MISIYIQSHPRETFCKLSFEVCVKSQAEIGRSTQLILIEAFPSDYFILFAEVRIKKITINIYRRTHTG